MIQDYFSYLSSRMSMEASLLLDFYKKHPGKLGEAREILLQNFLETYLPKSLIVGSGFTLTASTTISTEQDIVIYDGLNNPVLFPNNRSAVYPHSAVRAIIEVKSNLDKADVEESVRKAAAFKQAWRAAPTVPLGGTSPPMEPLCCLFGFAGPDLLTVKANVIAAQKSVKEEDRLDLVCYLNSGVLASGTYFNTAQYGMPGSLHASAMKGAKGKAVATKCPDGLKAMRLDEHSLLVFYYWMSSYIMRMPPLFPDLIGYAPTGFKFGVEV